METSLAPVAPTPRPAAGGLRARARQALLAQRGHLVPWVPVMLAAGIGAWFALPAEPGPAAYAGLAALALLAGGLALRVGPALAPLCWALLLLAAGAGLAGGRAHLQAAPVLSGTYYGPVEGRVLAIDRSRAGALRLTLDRLVLARRAPDATPERIRLSLAGDWGLPLPRPGDLVMTTAWLLPPPGPSEPGGYDFRRQAWFARLGAVGRTQAPVLLAAPPESPGPALWIAAARRALAAHVVQAVGGREGAFAAALITGDRTAIPSEAVAALRASNLAHLLAISGLHMGLVAGGVFAALRFLLAAVPPLALRIPVRQVAAVAALPVAFGYLLLSGASVATERAFVMVSVMLLAVVLDRRALSLRAVAVAAVIVLVLRPESLLSPGFQMSFAATVALIAAFGALRDWRAARPPDAPGLPRRLRPVLALFLSSLVAGAATAPVAAAHFNVSAPYGLLANLAAVPLMGTLVMPAGLLALLLTPLGLAAPAWAVMRAGLAWILAVAETVAGWPGAVQPVPAPPWQVLPLLAGGALVVLLWRGRGRLMGVAGVLAAALLWLGAERPLALVTRDGGLSGVLNSAGVRVLDRSRGQGFAAASWLENDGDRASQAAAAARSGGRLRLRRLTGESPAPAIEAACAAGADVVLVPEAGAPALPARAGDCLILTGAALARLGPVALHQGRDGGLVLTGGATARLWAGAGAGRGARRQ